MTQLDEALRLSRILSRERKPLEKNDAYFEGEQPLKFLAPALEQQLGYRISPIVINLGRYAVDAYENRYDIEGFRYEGAEASDEELWQVYQANDGPYMSQQVHREGLALSRAYTIVGPGETPGDAPVITAESPFDAIHEDDPRTHQVRHGIKLWTDPDKTKWMTYHHADGWTTFYRKGREWVEDDSETDNGFGICRLVPMPNDPRTLGRYRNGKFDQRLGRSVFHDVIPLMDALNKIASDMMVSAEFHALPRRWATGLNENDFVDEVTGQQLDTFSLIAGRLWGVENKDAKFGQFSEASLENFHNTLKLLMQVAGKKLGLPAGYMNFATVNPPSADGIRAEEAQFVKRVERKLHLLGTKWERVQKLVLLTMGYPKSTEMDTIEVMWRDPATPTVAQKADAVVKLVGAKDGSGRSLLPIEQAREDLGYTATQQARMADWDAAAQRDVQIDAAMRSLNDVAGSGV